MNILHLNVYKCIYIYTYIFFSGEDDAKKLVKVTKQKFFFFFFFLESHSKKRSHFFCIQISSIKRSNTLEISRTSSCVAPATETSPTQENWAWCGFYSSISSPKSVACRSLPPSPGFHLLIMQCWQFAHALPVPCLFILASAKRWMLRRCSVEV